jgi:hypothetical protein
MNKKPDKTDNFSPTNVAKLNLVSSRRIEKVGSPYVEHFAGTAV